MRSLSLCLATTLAAAAPAVGQQDLLFSTLSHERTLVPLRPSLHVVEPQDLMAVTPVAPMLLGYTAEKFEPHDAMLTLVGDHDADASYWEATLSRQIDALCFARGTPLGGPNLRDVFFSTATDVPSVLSANPALMGDVVRVRPGGQFELFIAEGRVQASFGIAAGTRVNVDAFEYDPQAPTAQFPPAGPRGMVYLSLEEDHKMTINCGGAVKSLDVQDGAILAAPVLGFDAKGAILGRGILVATEADVGAMIFNSTIADHTGKPVGRLIGDLDGLDLDPIPGASPFFTTACGVFPHLKFCGERLTGGGIVSTHGGGSIAVINGLPMGSPVITDGTRVGLRPIGVGSLNALETGIRTCRLVTETRGPVVPGGSIANIDIGGAQPGSAIYLLLSSSIAPMPAGGIATAIGWANPCFPELMVPIAGAPIFVGAAAANGTQEFNLPWGGGIQLGLVWQAFEITAAGALHLSTPIQQELHP